MNIEHDQLAPNLFFSGNTIPASYSVVEQIADHAQHRLSMIALRRQRGEALWKLFSEEDRPVVVDPALEQLPGVLLYSMQGTTFSGNLFRTSENIWLSCTFKTVGS